MRGEMSGRMRRNGTTQNFWKLAVAASGSLAVAVCLSACENVAGTSVTSLVRVIDASYIAPAVNVYVEGELLAGNIGEGYSSAYGTFTPANDAKINITQATGGTTLITADATLTGGAHHSVFLTDNGQAKVGYTVTVLEDQQISAASGQSAFRFINQAPKVGAVDVYVVPATSTFANSTALVSDLAVGQTAGYISFAAQPVTLVIVPTGLTTPKYTSATLALTGGEVRTVMIIDSQLTSNPPATAVIVSDVN